MAPMVHRPFVTFPNGAQMFLCANVQTVADMQAVVNRVGSVVEQQLGTQVHAMSPEQRKEFAAKVEFFRVAWG